jgi:putative RNA 2'-phosphotransferase
MDKSLVKASKFLSLVLRHDPGRVGITLDHAGWVDVDLLLAAVRRSGVALDRPTLDRIVTENDKKRFAFSVDGARIRASQGHSVSVDLGLAPQAPPEILFHGTAARSVDSNRRDGLRPRSRTHVHLSRDEETAVAVGRRHGKPVVLRIAAGEMHRAGHELMVSENGVWLARAVPVEFIAFPDQP